MWVDVLQLTTIMVIPCLVRLGVMFSAVHDLVKCRAMPRVRTRIVVNIVIPP